MTEESFNKFIDVRRLLQEKAPRMAAKIPSFAIDYLTGIVHQDEINGILNSHKDKEGVEFMSMLVDYFDIKMNIYGEENLPSAGRCIFASNHPLGGFDGVCLSYVVGQRYNGMVRLPVNDLLLLLPNLRSIFIPVNKHGRQERRTVALTDEAYSSENQIVTFPAGLCSRKIKGKIVDLEWKKSFIQKAVDYKRDIVPVFFDGGNSNFFYRLANIRKKLGIKINIEMLYLPDELFKSSHSTYGIYFGKPIPWTTFDKSRSAREWVDYVRQQTYSLKK